MAAYLLLAALILLQSPPQKGDRGYINHPQVQLFSKADTESSTINTEFLDQDAQVEVVQSCFNKDEAWLRVNAQLTDGSVIKNRWVDARFFAVSPWNPTLLAQKKGQRAGVIEDHFYDQPQVESRVFANTFSRPPTLQIFYSPSETSCYSQHLSWDTKAPIEIIRVKKQFSNGGKNLIYVRAKDVNGQSVYGFLDPLKTLAEPLSGREYVGFVRQGATYHSAPNGKKLGNWSGPDAHPIRTSRKDNAGKIWLGFGMQTSTPGEVALAWVKQEDFSTTQWTASHADNRKPSSETDRSSTSAVPEWSNSRSIMFAYLDQKHTFGGNGEKQVYPAGTWVHVLSRSGNVLTLRQRDGSTTTADFTNFKMPQILEYGWDGKEAIVQHAVPRGGFFKRYYRWFILGMSSGWFYRITSALLLMSFAAIAAIGLQIIENEDIDGETIGEAAYGTFILFLPLAFFGFVQGGFWGEYANYGELLNQKITASMGANGIIVPFSDFPTTPKLSFLYHIFNLIYVPFFALCHIPLPIALWPFFIGTHFLIVPHPGERSLRKLIRKSKPAPSEIQPMLDKMTAPEDAINNPPSAWKSRNEARRIDAVNNLIKKEEAVLARLLSLYRKKNELSERE